jgi:hypothetical protein
MLSSRTIIVLLTSVLIGVGVLTACSTREQQLLSATDIAKQVSIHYGDLHPDIVSVKSDSSDGSAPQPMYLMTLRGHFHKNTLTAHYLSFSALAEKMYVWNIYGYDQPGPAQLWDTELIHLDEPAGKP